MKKILLSIVSALMIFTLYAQVSENFSDYTVGGKLAQQAQAMGRMYWTTWGNHPGGSEDGVVADMSGNKCGHFTFGNDQVLKLGTKTTGAWDLTFKINVPTGKDGYFNVIAHFPASEGDFALQVGMGYDVNDPNQTNPAYHPGQAYIYAGEQPDPNQTVPVIVPFTHGEWINVKIHIDLDIDNAQMYFNDTQVHQWVYSLGTFGQGCNRVIDVFDIYPPSGASRSDYYIDDIVFAASEEAVVLYQTSFDDKPNGAYVAQSYPDWWTTWDNHPGTNEDALITNTQFASTPNSAKCDNGTDLMFLAGNKTSGVYTVGFDMYIPNAAPAYFNILHFFDSGNGGQDSEWALGVYMNIPSGVSGMPQGTNLRTGGSQNLTPFTVPSNAWFPVLFHIDLDANEATATINNVEVLTWPFDQIESGGTGVRQLGRLDFYPPTSSSVFYLDNFVYTQIGGDHLPVLNVTPAEIVKTMISGENATVPVTITNSGTSIGDFFTWMEFELGTPQGNYQFNIAHCADNPSTLGIGFTVAGYAEMGIKLSASDLCDKMGSSIKKMSYYLGGNGAVQNDQLLFRIYGASHDGVNCSGEILAEAALSNAVVGDWNEVTFSNPVLINQTELWLSVAFIQPEGSYPIAHDGLIQKPDANWFKRSADVSTWNRMWDDPQYGNLMIKAYAEGGVSPSCWLSLTGDTYGSVLAGNNKTYNAVLNATGLTEGVYHANIKIKTNDTEHPLFTIPCTITVVDAPFFTVTPDAINKTIIEGGAPVTVEVTVKNIGSKEGNYTVSGATVDWMKLSGSLTGTVAPNATSKFNVELDAEGLAVATYTTTIAVGTTGANGTINIPCTLIVSKNAIGEYEIQTLVYPNPANDNVTIQSNKIINSVQIINYVGQTVYSAQVNQDNTTVNTSNFGTGIYFVRIDTNAGSQTVKLIVK